MASATTQKSTTASTTGASLDYEVFGKVQGVFFRKHTKTTADTLGVSGWVQNTKQGTVKGQIIGPVDSVLAMKKWLRTTGSPKSTISKAIFAEQVEVPLPIQQKFEILR